MQESDERWKKNQGKRERENFDQMALEGQVPTWHFKISKTIFPLNPIFRPFVQFHQTLCSRQFFMTRNAMSFVGSKEIHFVSPIFIRLSSILVWECYECFCTHFPFEKVRACKFGEDKIKPQILKQKRDKYWYRFLSDLYQSAKNANLNPKMLEIMFSKKKKKKN